MLTSLIPALVPLQDPMLGVAANPGFVLHGFVVIALVSFGCVLQFRAPRHISISNLAAVCIALLASVQLSAIVALVGFLWRFPVPFSWATCFFFWVTSLVTASVVVLRGTLRQHGPVRAALVAFLPSFVVQSSQVIVYPAFSSLFEYTSESGQVVLTLLFPSVKYVFRSLVRKLSRHLGEDAEEVTVSSIEICAAMYQSMVMQSTPSPYTTALVIGVDVVQGLVAIYVSMAKRSTQVPLSGVVAYAKEIVGQQDCSVVDDELTPFASVKTSPLMSSVWKRTWCGFHGSNAVTPRERSRKSRSQSQSQSQSQSSKDKQILTHALEIVQSAESILIVEYFEVSVPIMNAFFLLWSSQFASAVYNPKIRLYFYDRDLLGSAIQSLAVYTVLQLLSVVVMHVVMWRRFRVSATVLLAFVLEHHAWSLQGKLVGWLSAIFQLPVMHYGESYAYSFL